MRTPHALITGGSRGIGLATAQLFAKHGYRCTLISRSEAALEDAVRGLDGWREIPEASGVEPSGHSEENCQQRGHSYIVGDVSESGFWSLPSLRDSITMEQNFARHFPKPSKSEPDSPSRIDVLVNCAGIRQASLFTRTPEDEIERILSTNLAATMLGTRFLLRHGYFASSRLLKASRATLNPKTTSTSTCTPPSQSTNAKSAPLSPVIINISSLLALSGGYGAVAYAASKAGLLGFTRGLAAEYASHGVRINAITPGFIETDMTEDLNHAEQRIPLRRFGTPHEVAHAVLFLAQNEYANNCVIGLDGGLSAV